MLILDKSKVVAFLDTADFPTENKPLPKTQLILYKTVVLHAKTKLQMTKDEFLENINEIISDRIYLTDNLDELKKEIENNHWSIGIDSDTVKNVKKDDLRDFFRKIVNNRIVQLDQSELNVDLTFYSWFDEQAGNLNLNLINSRHENLPFTAKLEFVDSIDTIINSFLKSKYFDGIPWNELEDNEETDFKLKIYKEEILKSTKAQHSV